MRVFLLAAAVTFACAAAAQLPSSPIQAAEEPQIPAPYNAALPSIVIIGDSTASYHPDTANEGAAAIQGWGVLFPIFFDPAKVNVVNLARGGRSSRTFITEGLWDKALARVRPHDIVLIQLGQNDVFAINDSTRARGTIPGMGDKTEEIDNQLTHQHETVHTYGWYIAKMVRDAKAKGAAPIVLSLTPRDVWKDGHVEVGVNNYREICFRVAAAEHVDFDDASALIAAQYEKLGQEKVFGLFHTREPVHFNSGGAFVNARYILSGLKGLPDAPVSAYLSYMGQQVEAAAAPPVPVDWKK